MLLQKLLLGVTLAAPIGPVSIEMIKRGLKSGFWAAFNIRLGGAIGNTVCLLGAFFGLSALQGYNWVFTALGILGSILLLYMAVTTLIKAFKPIYIEGPGLSSSDKHPLMQSLVLGLMLAIFNPIGVMFWLGIFANDVDPNQTIGLYEFFINFQIIIGVLLWGAFLSFMLAVGRKSLNPTILRAVTLGSGLVLFYFGAKYGYQNLSVFWG